MADIVIQPKDLQRILQDPALLQQELQNHPQRVTSFFQELLNRGLNQSENTPTSSQNRANVDATPDAPSIHSTKSEKHPDPPIFSGSPTNWREFKTQLRVKLLINADRYPTTQSRLAYTVSRLQGNPLSIITPKIIRGVILFNDYEDLLESLDTAYDDPNIKIKAQRELRILKQRNREFYLYLPDFHRLIEDTGITDHEALKSALMGGLSIELLNLLVHHDIPDQFNDLVKLLQGLDSRYRQTLTLQREFSDRPTSHNRDWSPRPTIETQQPLGDPMDLGALTKKAPTKEEKDRRFRDNLCYYCGDKGHYAINCPKTSQRNPKRSLLAQPRPKIGTIFNATSKEESPTPKNEETLF